MNTNFLTRRIKKTIELHHEITTFYSQKFEEHLKGNVLW
jgi:hypothetical protein